MEGQESPINSLIKHPSEGFAGVSEPAQRTTGPGRLKNAGQFLIELRRKVGFSSR
jgi:hypothetical protein